MFYFLIFHTSISASKTIDKKMLTTFLYGSVLYLILHGLIKTSKYDIFKHLADYYWYCIIIDVATLIYLTWGIIDYQGMLERFIDTSVYSNNGDENKNQQPLFQSKMDMNSIDDYINNIKQQNSTSQESERNNNSRNDKQVKNNRQVNIDETANEVCNFNGDDSPNSIIRNEPRITTARDMGLEQSTSLDELGLNNIEEMKLNNEPIETGIQLPDGAKDFFSESIDISDHVSNISDIEDIDLDDFANNLQ
jgi:hypothetical protein